MPVARFLACGLLWYYLLVCCLVQIYVVEQSADTPSASAFLCPSTSL